MFETTCDNHGRWLSPEATEQIATCMENGLLCLNVLAVEAESQRKFLWFMPPKAHMATHMAFDFAATGVNPRRITCYSDEDMVGRMKIIIESCHGATAGHMGLLRYAILVCTRWWTLLTKLRLNPDIDVAG